MKRSERNRKHGSTGALFAVWRCKVLAKNHSKCNFDERMRKRISKTDFSFFCAVSAPEAGLEELRTLCDWGNWVRLTLVVDRYFRVFGSFIDVSTSRSFLGMIVYLSLHRSKPEAETTASVRRGRIKSVPRKGSADDGKSPLNHA